jgi:hypothetical protein
MFPLTVTLLRCVGAGCRSIDPTPLRYGASESRRVGHRPGVGPRWHAPSAEVYVNQFSIVSRSTY